MWKLQVLGSVQLTPVKSANIPRMGAKSEAVLTYLGVRGVNPSSRRGLIELLWADRSNGDSHNAFRQWLFHFRRTFGEACPVRSEGEQLWIDRTVCEVDLWRFLELAQSDEPRDWREACAVFSGDLADQLSATPEFDHWLAAHRELVRSTARDLLARMSQGVYDAAVVAPAARLARLLITADPLDEAAYRALMIMQDAGGQRAKALETWRECRKALMSEVGVGPSAETISVHERIHDTAPTLVKWCGFPLVRLGPGSSTALPAPGSDDAMEAAVDAMLRGFHHYFHGSAEDNVQARAAFQSAARLCPQAAQPGVLSAFTHFTDFNYGWNGNPLNNYRKAAAMAASLRRRYPTDWGPHTICGRLLLWKEEYQAAIEEFEIALAGLESPWQLAALAEAKMCVGKNQEAIDLARHALEMEPNDHGIFKTIEGMARFAMGDLDAALHAFSSAVRRYPKYCVAQGGLAAVHAELGDIEAAQAATAAAKLQNVRMSLEFARSGMPMADPSVRRRWIKAWSAAGMPKADGSLTWQFKDRPMGGAFVDGSAGVA